MYGLVWPLVLALDFLVGVVMLSSQSQTERKSMQYAPSYSCMHTAYICQACVLWI